MVRLDDTSGSNSAQETLSGGSFDWKPDAIDTGLDGMGNGDMHVPVDGLKVVVSVDTSLNGGVGVEDSYNGGDTASDNIKLGRSGDWKGDGSGGEHLEHFNHRFLAGDFVWGKIRSQPWWPGQVFYQSDASEYAQRYFQLGRYLVAFFGGGSASWCLPSQLVPFAKNFKENNPVNPVDLTSKILCKAVQAAVDEVGRVVESTMTCNCMPLEKRDDLARRTVSNAGLKAGATVPKVDVHRLSVPEYGPGEVLAEVMHYAKSVSIDSRLELAVLRSWLSAFYYAKDGRRLPEYHEYIVEGLEDKDQTAAAAADDFSVPIEVPILRPTVEEWLTPPAVDDAMTEEPSSAKTYHIRKRKSVAVLMKESNRVKASSQKKPPPREGKGSRKSASSLKRKMKGIDGEAAEGGSRVVSSRKNGKKIKSVASGTPIVFGGDSSNAGHGATTAEDNARERNSAGKPTAIVIASTENVSDKAIEESNNASTPRERKKSRYLSPPYVFPEWRIAKIQSRPDKTSKTDQQGENVHNVSENVSASQQNLMVVYVTSNEKLHGDQPNELGNPSPRSGQNEKKLTFSISDISMPANELLTWVRIAAVAPLYLDKEGTFDVVWAFISAFRSSIYVHGENYKMYKKYNRVRKRKSVPSKLGKQHVNLSAESPGSADFRSPRALKIEEGKPVVPVCSKIRSSYPKPASSDDSALEKRGSSLPDDDFMSDARLISKKVDTMIAILDNYHAKFSTDAKSSLKDDMKYLMDCVETVSEKVRVLAETLV